MIALIIDSSKSYRQLLSKVLEDYGFQTILAANLVDAKTSIQLHNFDIICIAMKLSDGDSFSFCQSIRNNPICKTVPIFMLTASKDTDTNHQALSCGVTEVFRKQDFIAFQRYLENLINRLDNSDSTGGRILYIEDSASTAFFIKSVLEDQGYKVDHFLTAEEGIIAFNDFFYDLVLTDVVLADLSGLTVVRKIREAASEEKRSTPVIAVSSFNDDARKLELFAAGVNDYVSKPVLNEELIARINNLITTQNLLTKLNNKQQQLERLALTDQLTSLYNRHFLMDMAPKKIKQAQRQNYPMSFIVIDIDHFKAINDNYGHAVGDKVLIAVAAQLASGIRWEDIAARFGGEEFVILLDHCDQENAIKIAEDLRKSLETLNPSDIHVTASFGVTMLKPGEFDFSNLFARADQAVYEAKDKGRNCVVFNE